MSCVRAVQDNYLKCTRPLTGLLTARVAAARESELGQDVPASLGGGGALREADSVVEAHRVALLDALERREDEDEVGGRGDRGVGTARVLEKRGPREDADGVRTRVEELRQRTIQLGAPGRRKFEGRCRV